MTDIDIMARELDITSEALVELKVKDTLKSSIKISKVKTNKSLRIDDGDHGHVFAKIRR